jgi:glycosyltransferase involved in cell wall biosynthesis
VTASQPLNSKYVAASARAPSVHAHRITVLMVSTSYPTDASDWKGIFIRHMAGSLARRSDIQLTLWSPPGELPECVSSSTTSEEAIWLNRLMEAGGISHLMRSGGWRTMAAPFRLLSMLRACYRRQPATELYHINWLQCALPLPRDGKPALITVLGNDLKLLRIPLMGHLMRRAFRGRRVTLCPNAEWMEEPLRRVFEGSAAIVPVTFGIDPRWYHIRRRLSGVPKWLVVTRLTDEKLGPLFEWSEPLFNGQPRELHLFGPMQEDIQVPPWVHYHGPASADSLSSEWFPQAHGLITLSRHAEGRPQVMLEAMAAGLPIIASDMPAHASLVEHGRTGSLCRSPADYDHALKTLEEASLNLSYGTAAHSLALRTNGTWDDCAARYAAIYHKLLEPGDA